MKMHNVLNPSKAILCTLVLTAASAGQAVMLTGVTDSQTLITFDSTSPSALLSGKPISGLASNETILGIDYRPTTGSLYALGSYGNIYTLDGSTVGAATATQKFNINLDPMLAAKGGLMGSSFGFDFNPVADASGANSLRIVSNTGQNLAVNVDTGAVNVATPVAYVNGQISNIVGEAYTNSVLGGSTVGTTQYAIDAGTDGLVLQAFNAGTLTSVGLLNIDTSANVGFEIVAIAGDTIQNLAFATLNATDSSISHLFLIDLATGIATDLGQIDGGLLVPHLTSNPALNNVSSVPVPAAAWLFGTALFGLGATARRRK